MNRSYMGKVRSVDLSTGPITTEAIPDDKYHRFLSGTGLAAWLLYRRIPAKADPLGPDNILGFVSGILTASGSLFTGRWMVVGKSPLTGTWGDANCGGTLAPAIKGCGVDAIFFTGQGNRPVYLYADTKGAELRDASHLWGRDAVETERVLVEEYGSNQRVRVACIGMAGERRSLISGIVNHGGRLAARAGVDAEGEGLIYDGFIVRREGERLVRSGAPEQGVLYAVMDFLEREVGCRWYGPERKIVPQRETLSLEVTDVVGLRIDQVLVTVISVK